MFFTLFTSIALMVPWSAGLAAYRFSQFQAHPPIHVYGNSSAVPNGITPSVIKKIYHLPTSGGTGTIAIIGAYNDRQIENDLHIFSTQFNLPVCTIANGCFEQHVMTPTTKENSGWSMETSLDVEWAHAIAPNAKILLVEAATPSGTNLLKAIDYARNRPDVVAISMSWGGQEFSDETALDAHFTSDHGITFFASSGDNGTGASWPAASPNVVAVGGTSVALKSDGTLESETAWSGSGGGISAYEPEPVWQKNYAIKKANGARAIPDVSYNADPASGFAVYRSTGKSKKNWYTFGGTSAGAPQWAAIQALGLSVTNEKLYADKDSDQTNSFFRDIVSGANGDCGYLCLARKHYDYVTGLGSPVTVTF